MKKFVLIFAIILCGAFSANAQFKAGLSAGIPVGDISDYSNFHFGADVGYMFDVSEQFSVGPMLGYSSYFGEDAEVMGVDIEAEDIQFLPIAASGRFGLNDAFFLGADLGYAVGINDGNDGGFFYRPQVGYDFGLIGLVLSYSGVSVDGGSVSSVNLGLEFGL